MPTYRALEAMLKDLDVVRTQLDALHGWSLTFTAHYNSRTDHLTSVVQYAYIHDETLILVIEAAVIHHTITHHVRWSATHQWHIITVRENDMPVIGVAELRPRKLPAPVLP